MRFVIPALPMTNKNPYFSSIEAQQNGNGIRSQGLLRFCPLLPWYAESGLIRSTTLAVPKHMQTTVKRMPVRGTPCPV